MLCLCLCLCVCVISCHQATRVSRLPLAREPVLTVTTYNVNYAHAGDASTLAAIAAAPSDLVFLQETNDRWQKQIQARLLSVYPYQKWIACPQAGGQAVLSRRPFTVRDVLPAPTGWFPAVRVLAETPLGMVQVLSVHLHPQITEEGSWLLGYLFTDPARLTEIAAYLPSLEASIPTLIVGDFNEGTRGMAMRFLEARGFRSALPEFAPEADTWRWPLGTIELTGQLDHLTYDAALEPLTAAAVPAGGSDHLPVRAVFARAATGTSRPGAPQGVSISVRLR